MPRIEALLAARLFMVPQRVGDRLFFLSDLSGRLSLYAMDLGGSVPEPLLPPDIALQNPHHMDGYSFAVFPALGKILVMIDHNGDENYQPMVVPIEGGFPAPAFGDRFAGMQVDLQYVDYERATAFLHVDARTEALNTVYEANLASGELIELGHGVHGPFFNAVNESYTRAMSGEAYNIGDGTLFIQELGSTERRVVFGTPLDQRGPDFVMQNHGFGATEFIDDEHALVVTMLFNDSYGLAVLKLDGSQQIEPATIVGAAHTGAGELDALKQIAPGRYIVGYNIDGCAWRYEGAFDPATRVMTLEHVLCGQGELSNGVIEALQYDAASDSYALSFSTATTPTQLYTIEGADRGTLRRHTRERILGLPAGHLAAGEDASFVSHDGLRVSARLYLPAPALGFDGPRPLVYYIHGGPQGQERPDFAWFSMPLIQFLTLSGFAVFVPNVRGSTGYGFDYMNKVTHDWGGQDRLDHVHAMTKVLPLDPRLDVGRAGVIGRSYGGFMTLTLAARHPELWGAAIDMFGPYDLFTFSDRVPETWKPYMTQMVGDPVTERDFLTERSPRTYIGDLRCPLLVIQGANDPRVIERESAELVAELRERGKQVEYLPF
ncbi:MAG TPA: alpha/beta fold hydrolase, partial [Herpetosiphonaceae bacterium]|nr:alpha/beta fold hydrolase [Herpetosiphonaceae bacterium]